MSWLDRIWGHDKLEESGQKLSKSFDDLAMVVGRMNALLVDLHALGDRRVEELFDKYEVTFTPK